MSEWAWLIVPKGRRERGIMLTLITERTNDHKTSPSNNNVRQKLLIKKNSIYILYVHRYKLIC